MLINIQSLHQRQRALMSALLFFYRSHIDKMVVSRTQSLLVFRTSESNAANRSKGRGHSELFHSLSLSIINGIEMRL